MFDIDRYSYLDCISNPDKYVLPDDLDTRYKDSMISFLDRQPILILKEQFERIQKIYVLPHVLVNGLRKREEFTFAAENLHRWYRDGLLLPAEAELGQSMYGFLDLDYSGYEEGILKITDQDKAKPALWCINAAGQGDAYAQFELGRMYEMGRGVAQDDSEAVNWYRKAAKQGNGEAAARLRELGE